MTLRASKTEKSPTFGLYKATLSKNIGSIILLSVAMLIYCPGFFVASLSQITFRASDYNSPDALSALYGVSVTLSCILVCVGNYVNFSYLYKKSSSDVFHALPLTRSSLLISRAAACFTGLLIPLTIGYTALVCLTVPYPTYAIGTIAQIASAYLVNVLMMAAFSAFSLIFIVCAGSGFDLAVSFFGFNVAVLAVGGIIDSLCESYLSGYSMQSELFLRTLSPIYYLAERSVMFANNDYALSESVGLIFDIIKYTVVFAIISPLLYRFRKAERGEQAYAYKFIYVICGVLAGICGGYALSEIFIFAVGQKEYSVIGFVAFVAGALITTVVYGAVTDRGFKGFKRSMIIGGGSAVVYGIIAVIIVSGAFGFENRIPAADKVTAATVVFDDTTVDFTDAKCVIDLHKAIIEKDADDDFDDTVDTPHTYVTIDYNLSGKGNVGNGDMLRQYFVDKTKLKDELFAVYASDNRFEKIEKELNAANGKIDIWGDYSEGEDSFTLDGTLSRANAKRIIEVYKKELRAVGKEIFSEKSQTGIVASFNLYIDNTSDSYSLDYYTTADFTETNKLLSEYIASDEKEMILQ
ncbi:MAG: hypothetical protein J5662_03195 [Clostridia bacterium]|nr:hypothetical protein [Clostridia bacterium]